MKKLIIIVLLTI